MDNVNNSLQHYGVLGMKWGVRRYQNKDGSLTAAGKNRYYNSDGTISKFGKKYYDSEMARLKNESVVLKNRRASTTKLRQLNTLREKNQTIKDELAGKKIEDANAKKERIKQENELLTLQYNNLLYKNKIAELTPKKVAIGQKMVDYLKKETISQIVKPATTEWLKKTLGLNENDVESLKVQAQKMKSKEQISTAKRKIQENEDWAEKREQKRAEKHEQERAEKKEKKNQKNQKKTSDPSSDDTPTYSGTVEGKGTSRFTGWKNNSKYKKAAYREVNKSANTSLSTELAIYGKDIYDEYFNL